MYNDNPFKLERAYQINVDSSYGLVLSLEFEMIEFESLYQNPVGKIFTESDNGELGLSYSLEFANKDVTNGLVPLSFSRCELIQSEHSSREDVFKNYTLSHYVAYGMITPRPIRIEVTPISKVYDGNCNIEFNVKYYDADTFARAEDKVDFDTLIARDDVSIHPN